MADSFQISPTELKFKFELRKTIPVRRTWSDSQLHCDYAASLAI